MPLGAGLFVTSGRGRGLAIHAPISRRGRVPRRHGLARSARFFEKSREGSGVEWSEVEWS